MRLSIVFEKKVPRRNRRSGFIGLALVGFGAGVS